MKDDTSPELPERLCAEGATEFEQRLLRAAAREQPSRELSERMAAALQISPPAPTSTGEALLEPTAAPQVVGATRTLLPWVSGTAVVAIAGAILFGRSQPTAPAPHVSARPGLTVSASPSNASPTERVAEASFPAQAAPSSTTRASMPRSRPTASAASDDLQEQIALIDAARALLAGGAGERALTKLSEYQRKYPAGSFRPEALALRVEALMAVGKTAQARALATRFVAENPSNPLSARVARAAGLEPSRGR